MVYICINDFDDKHTPTPEYESLLFSDIMSET